MGKGKKKDIFTHSLKEYVYYVIALFTLQSLLYQFLYFRLHGINIAHVFTPYDYLKVIMENVPEALGALLLTFLASAILTSITWGFITLLGMGGRLDHDERVFAQNKLSWLILLLLVIVGSVAFCSSELWRIAGANRGMLIMSSVLLFLTLLVTMGFDVDNERWKDTDHYSAPTARYVNAISFASVFLFTAPVLAARDYFNAEFGLAYTVMYNGEGPARHVLAITDEYVIFEGDHGDHRFVQRSALETFVLNTHTDPRSEWLLWRLVNPFATDLPEPAGSK